VVRERSKAAALTPVGGGCGRPALDAARPPGGFTNRAALRTQILNRTSTAALALSTPQGHSLLNTPPCSWKVSALHAVRAAEVEPGFHTDIAGRASWLANVMSRGSGWGRGYRAYQGDDGGPPVWSIQQGCDPQVLLSHVAMAICNRK